MQCHSCPMEMTAWELVPAPDPLPVFVPHAPSDPYVFLRGRLEFHPAPEYETTYRALRERGEFTVALQVARGEVFRNRIWIVEGDGCWYWQSTHVTNTLLDDMKFYTALTEVRRAHQVVPDRWCPPTRHFRVCGRAEVR